VRTKEELFVKITVQAYTDDVIFVSENEDRIIQIGLLRWKFGSFYCMLNMSKQKENQITLSPMSTVDVMPFSGDFPGEI
jgi:hypothetical protein